MSIKKNRIRLLIDGFCKYTLLKLVIEVAHIDLVNYDWCFNQGLEYMLNQSLEIIVDIL